MTNHICERAEAFEKLKSSIQNRWYWEDENTSSVVDIKTAENSAFGMLDVIDKSDDELVYSNWIGFYLKNYEKLAEKFAYSVLGIELMAKRMEVKREYHNIDLWIEDEDLSVYLMADKYTVKRYSELSSFFDEKSENCLYIEEFRKALKSILYHITRIYIKLWKNPAKLGISGQKGANNYNDKSTILMPRQESGTKGISWNRADTLGHNFSRTECKTRVLLRLMKIRNVFLQLLLKSVRKSLKGVGNKGYR